MNPVLAATGMPEAGVILIGIHIQQPTVASFPERPRFMLGS